MSGIPAFSVKLTPSKDGKSGYIEVVWRSPAAPRSPSGELRQVKRRLGPAWHDRLADGQWRRRKGAVPDGSFVKDANATTVAAAKLVERVEAELITVAAIVEAEASTFRRLALEWLKAQERRDAKPSYLRNCRSMLAEPGVPLRRGTGTSKGRIMRAFGNRDATTFTTAEVEDFLIDSGLSATGYNRHRDLMLRVLRWADGRELIHGLDESIRAIERVPKRQEADHRSEATYSVDEVEAIASALSSGRHVRGRFHHPAGDTRDAAAVRLMLYTGLRLGEVLALEWDQIRDLSGPSPHILVSAALSAGVRSTPKNRQSRRVPLPPQAVAALSTIADKSAVWGDKLVFRGAHGSHMDPGAFRRRFDAARESVGVPHRGKLHALRHTAGTTVAVAYGAAVARDLLGHSKIATTDRYMRSGNLAQDGQAIGEAFLPRRGNRALHREQVDIGANGV